MTRTALYLATHLIIAAAYIAAVSLAGVPWLWPGFVVLMGLADGGVKAFCRAVVG